MIPGFDDNGYLPPGIHKATLEEIAERFGQESAVRKAEMRSLGWLVDVAKRAGVLRIIVNGSFVTDELEPNDVDCALLLGRDFPRDREAAAELKEELPFLQTDLLTEEYFDYYIDAVFGTDRQGVAKGMIEVIL
jgi:hypothetical protein